jgi:hypothetical protein
MTTATFVLRHKGERTQMKCTEAILTSYQPFKDNPRLPYSPDRVIEPTFPVDCEYSAKMALFAKKHSSKMKVLWDNFLYCCMNL